MVKTHIIGNYTFFYYARAVDAFWKSQFIGTFDSSRDSFREDCRNAYRGYRRILHDS